MTKLLLTTKGQVKPICPSKEGPYFGLPVGSWAKEPFGVVVTLFTDVDTIRHEVATRRSVRSELRAAGKDKEGFEPKKVIKYNPVKRKFYQEYL